jgi:hypothetical protein
MQARRDVGGAGSYEGLKILGKLGTDHQNLRLLEMTVLRPFLVIFPSQLQEYLPQN